MLSGQEAQNDPDDAIRATDDDAAASRLYVPKVAGFIHPLSIPDQP
jgi:hypothetical protein